MVSRTDRLLFVIIINIIVTIRDTTAAVTFALNFTLKFEFPNIGAKPLPPRAILAELS